MNRSPQLIMDLMNGYCKKKFNHSIPISLLKLMASYFWVFKSSFLFVIDFIACMTQVQDGYPEALTSIASYFVVPIECYRMNFFMINLHANNKQQLIGINIGDNVSIKLKETEFPLTMRNGDKWQIETQQNFKFIEIMFRMTRKTNCDCDETDGNIEIVCRNIQSLPYFVKDNKRLYWESHYRRSLITDDKRLYGRITRKEGDGYYKMQLPSNFDYGSKEYVMIEAHGIDKLNIWSSKHAAVPCQDFGFARQCCVDAVSQYVWDYISSNDW